LWMAFAVAEWDWLGFPWEGRDYDACLGFHGGTCEWGFICLLRMCDGVAGWGHCRSLLLVLVFMARPFLIEMFGLHGGSRAWHEAPELESVGKKDVSSSPSLSPSACMVSGLGRNAVTPAKSLSIFERRASPALSVPIWRYGEVQHERRPTLLRSRAFRDVYVRRTE